jgi:hypothetical protein
VPNARVRWRLPLDKHSQASLTLLQYNRFCVIISYFPKITYRPSTLDPKNLISILHFFSFLFSFLSMGSSPRHNYLYHRRITMCHCQRLGGFLIASQALTSAHSKYGWCSLRAPTRRNRLTRSPADDLARFPYRHAVYLFSSDTRVIRKTITVPSLMTHHCFVIRTCIRRWVDTIDRTTDVRQMKIKFNKKTIPHSDGAIISAFAKREIRIYHMFLTWGPWTSWGLDDPSLCNKN